MNSNFCVAPFIQACIDTQGETRPCCSYTPYDKSTGNINTDGGLETAMHSLGMTKLREQFLANEKPEGCAKCWKEEEQHGKDWSMRTTYNEKYGDLIAEDETNFTKDYFKLKYIETGFGNLCNLACKMCIPAVSSTLFGIVKANAKNKWKDGYLRDISYIDTDIKELDYIKLIGGEPMMERKHDQLLEQLLKDHPNPGNITICYFTNTTKKPSPRVVEMWSQFKEIELNHSIDGVGKVNEYQRPGNYVWQDIEDVLDYYEELGKTITLKQKINSTITVANMMSVESLWKWSYDRYQNTIFHSCQLAYQPLHLNPQHIHPDLKQKIRDRLTAIDLTPYESNPSGLPTPNAKEYRVLIRDVLTVMDKPTEHNFTIDDILQNEQFKRVSEYYNHSKDWLYEEYS
jgi:MoaA/NifB/PqqE/SkfB family radical SAM enzyme